jgi:dTDP-glucose 4,6-dehydratase
MNKILVLASNSFTGSHFIDKALKDGHDVIGISRSDEYPAVMLPYRYNKKVKNFKFFKLDLNRNLNLILEIIDKERPKIIANFAAQGEVRTSWSSPSQWFTTNCLAIVKLTQELIKRDFIEKYITSSTPEVYGSTDKDIKENNNFKPSTPYAASKLAGDLHLMTLFHRYNFPVLFTRAANIYGIHQQLYRIIPRTIIYLKKNIILDLHGNGKSIRSFIHIRDVIDAKIKILSKGITGNVYHISPKNSEISIYNLVKLICEIMKCDFEKAINKIDENYGQDSIYSLDSSKLRNELNWCDKISLEEGIIETINWINDNWITISKLPHDYIHKI